MRTIRLASSADLDSLSELDRHLKPDMPTLPRERVLTIWAEHMAKGVEIFVCVVGRQLAASCTLIVVPNLTRGRPYAFVENVVTHSDFRRQGHGRAVVVAAIDRAWALDCCRVMLLTGRTDEAIFRFYESCGFAAGLKTGFLAQPPG